MPVYFYETRETIDLLRRVVDKLGENNGCIGAEELWDGVQCVPANVRSPNLTVARHGIRQMEGVLAVLRSLMSTLAYTCKAHIHTTRRRARIPQLTIASLPLEIIHHIVNDAHDCTRPHWLVRYSHVSSKIRNVILDSPSLWASIHLSLNMPTSLIKTIISRSAALELTVFIDELSWSSGLSTALVVYRLTILFEHHHRWRDVTLSVTFQSAKLILEHFPHAILSSVRVFRAPGLRYNFFENWDIPRLEELVWSSQRILPPSRMATQMLHTCSLSLLLPLSTSGAGLDLMGMSAFLNAASGLRSLKLELTSSLHGRPAELPEITLHHLEHLQISIQDNPEGEMRVETTRQFLKTILCPSLKHLSSPASIRAGSLEFPENVQGRYPLLISLTLTMPWDDQRDDLILDEFLCSLPSTIEKVKLWLGCTVELHISRRDGSTPNILCTSLPNLKDLDLQCCDAREENFYANLSDMLKRFCVTLNYFQPCRDSFIGKKNAITTLRRAGVLVDLYPTS